MDKNNSQRNRPRMRRGSIDGFIQSPKNNLNNKTFKINPQKPSLINLSNRTTYKTSQLLEKSRTKNASLDGLVHSTLAPTIDNQLNQLSQSESPKKLTTFKLHQPIGRQRKVLLKNSIDSQPSSTIKSKKHRLKGWKKRTLAVFLVILILGLSFGGWDAYQLYSKVQHINVDGLISAPNGSPENILVAGSTNRCNLKVQNAQWGFCSDGVTGVNSDIILIFHFVPKTRTVTIMSIPRDTFVPNARKGHQSFKIDAALYEGPSQLVRAVEEDFDIPIQHYVEVGFDGFVNIVNAVGGIKMNFSMPVYDAYSHLDITSPGCKLLNGVEALQVVRARHLQYKPANITTMDHYYWPYEQQSDIGRIDRTHEFLDVLASTVKHEGLGNPIVDQKFLNAVLPNVKIDSSFSTEDILQLVDDFHSVNLSSVPEYTMPVGVTGFGSYIFNNYDYGDVVFPVDPMDHNVIDQFLNIKPNINPLNGQLLPRPNTIKVNVVNGSGINNQAHQVSSQLANLGFQTVGQLTSVTPGSTQATETVVYYANSSDEADAEEVDNQLTGYVVLSKNPSMVTPGSDVTVLTGSGLSVTGDQAEINATSKASNVTKAINEYTASKTSNQALIKAQATYNISPPTVAKTQHKPWDPTACS